MRSKNIVLLVSVWFAALGAYVVTDVGGQILFSPTHTNGHIEASSSTILHLHFGVSFVVAVLAGAVLCRVVESQVPLKWCLGLGTLFACMHLLPIVLLSSPLAVKVSPSVWIFNVAEALAYTLLPVFGGYFVKRRDHRAS
jgi:hypothetical protein